MTDTYEVMRLFNRFRKHAERCGFCEHQLRYLRDFAQPDEIAEMISQSNCDEGRRRLSEWSRAVVATIERERLGGVA